ncbi:MAG: GH25 family lysozyme [Acidobacteriota bacterium]
MINGVDVSHHNNIVWKDVQKLNLTENLYFVFAKASEGIDFIDNKFAENRRGSTDAGLLFGAYHFFLPTKDAVEQAKTFTDQIGTLKPGELPPVVDIEWAMRGKKGSEKELWKEISAAERIEVVKTFLHEVENRVGMKPLIYTAVSFWNEFIVHNNQPSNYAFFTDHPLWIVNLKGALTVPKPWANASFGQNGFGELAPKNATAFQKLDHDFFNGKLRGLLSLTSKGKVFAKKSPVSAIVRDFQQSLKILGFYDRSLDGDFGKNTELAVKDFQNSIGIAKTGQIDEITWKLLV